MIPRDQNAWKSNLAPDHNGWQISTSNRYGLLSNHGDDERGTNQNHSSVFDDKEIEERLHRLRSQNVLNVDGEIDVPSTQRLEPIYSKKKSRKHDKSRRPFKNQRTVKENPLPASESSQWMENKQKYFQPKNGSSGKRSTNAGKSKLRPAQHDLFSRQMDEHPDIHHSHNNSTLSLANHDLASGLQGENTTINEIEVTPSGFTCRDVKPRRRRKDT